MKLKKFLAVALSTAMAFTLMVTPVYAEDSTQLGEGSGEVTGETTYVETTVYKVTLPTISALDFTLDPEGLVGFFTENENATEADAEDLADYAGIIVGTGMASATNKSSVPVLLTCTFSLENYGDTEFIATKRSDLTNAETGKESDNKILLEIVPTATASNATASNATPIEDLTGAGNTVNAIAVTTDEDAENTIAFALPEAAYKFTKTGNTYAYTQDTSVDPTGVANFAVTGYVAKDANWKALADATDPITLKCVYTFEPLTSIGSGATNNLNVVVDESKLVAGTGAVPTATDGGTVTLKSTASELKFKLNVPSGATVSKVTICYPGSTKQYPVTTTVDGSTVTVAGTEANIAYCLENPNSYTMYAVFSDGTYYGFTLTTTE